MLSIQEVGTELLTGKPNKFYIFVGSEIGIKTKYIECVKSHYGQYFEYPTVASVLNMMKNRHIIPLQPALYVVRYDEEFISSLSKQTHSEISQINIIGTLIVLYEDAKHTAKLSNYLPNYTVSIDPVNPQFIFKYLKSDFPSVPDKYLNMIVDISKNYSQAKNICRCLTKLDSSKLCSITKSELCKLVGHEDISNDAQLKIGIASRNFGYLISVLDKYQDSEDKVLYIILSTMTELDKLLSNKYAQSDLRPYLKVWPPEDIYYMFMHTYNELKMLRSMSVTPENSVIYLFGLLQFDHIPCLEDMR